jgi:hypothetical protein
MELKNNKRHLLPFNGTEEQQKTPFTIQWNWITTKNTLYHSMELKSNKKTAYTFQWNWRTIKTPYTIQLNWRTTIFIFGVSNNITYFFMNSSRSDVLSIRTCHFKEYFKYDHTNNYKVILQTLY